MTASDTIYNSGGTLIVGAGLAGLFAALKMAPRPVTVLSPEALGNGASSAWAQGGVAAAVGEGDKPEYHATDTLNAGAGIVDAATAAGVTSEAAEAIDDLYRLGAPFDKNSDGEYSLSREAAHGRARVVRVAGDGAGRAIMDALIAAVRNTPSINVIEGVIAVDFAIEDEKVVGVMARRVGDRYATPVFFRAKATVLAAGGLGGLYAVTTNPARVRGQAMGMAARAGAVIADAEFVQFHPTAIDSGRDPARLATEALRGEGAHLIDQNGKRFMLDIHPDAELAPRDIVARAIFRQIKAGNRPYLDTRDVLGAEIHKAFPAVASYCEEAGVDPVKDPIPVAPATHYHMGGVKVDEVGRSSLSGLWCCGEASSTGLHGANRLASNGLLEAVVFAARVANDISNELPESDDVSPLPFHIECDGDETMLQSLPAVAELRKLMTAHVGVERDEAGLRHALKEVARIEREAENVSRSYLNMTSAATMVIAAAYKRKESRGGHFRKDYPEVNADWAYRTEMTLVEALKIRDKAESEDE